MNDALKNILERNSHRSLVEPIPGGEEMELVYKAALRAPDHAWLRPTSFIEVQGEGLNRLSEAFGDYAKKHISNLEADRLEKYKAAPFRAPMVIILINTPKQHAKVPETEQIMSSAAAAQNILLALNSLGYAGIWRTGTFALNKNICKYLELNSDQQVLGYLYVGTPEGAAKKTPNLDPKDYVTKWK